jgi:hypothetical protein
MVTACALFVTCTGGRLPSARADEKPAEATRQEAYKIGIETYVYAFPLVLMDVTRQVHLAPANNRQRHLPNEFIHSREFPDPKFTSVVSPNADTLYSNAWLDLTHEPVILSVPEMGKRYYLMQFLDAWTNTFACPGTRTTGNGKGDFAIVGPHWKGELPAGVKEFRSPTNMVWLIGRTQTNGKEDYPAVRAIQDKYKLTPLSLWGKDVSPPELVITSAVVDTKTPPMEQVRQMDAATFYGRLHSLLKANPPAPADAPIVKRMAQIGIDASRPFDFKRLNPETASALELCVSDARQRLASATKRPRGGGINGWEISTNLGAYGTNYLFRSVVALFALGANLPEDAIYPRLRVDADGKSLSGANRYVLHFKKEELPPVQAFWSVTLYNSKQGFVENPIDRYAIGDRDHLKFNDDGSLTLYVQTESPGADKQSNWLPAPKDEFNLIMRLYWPKKAALDGTWSPPAVRRAG